MLVPIVLALLTASNNPCGDDAFLDGVVLHEWRAEDAAVIVCGFPPSAPGPSDWRKVRESTWEGYNLSVAVSAKDGWQFIAGTDVIDPIRIKANVPKIVVTELMHNCGANQVPFLETEIVLGPQPLPSVSTRLTYTTKPWAEKRVETLVALLAAWKPDDADPLPMLCELWEMAVGSPVQGLRAFQRLEKAAWNDGHSGEEYSTYTLQLERLSQMTRP